MQHNRHPLYSYTTRFPHTSHSKIEPTDLFNMLIFISSVGRLGCYYICIMFGSTMAMRGKQLNIYVNVTAGYIVLLTYAYCVIYHLVEDITHVNKIVIFQSEIYRCYKRQWRRCRAQHGVRVAEDKKTTARNSPFIIERQTPTLFGPPSRATRHYCWHPLRFTFTDLVEILIG